MCLLEQPLKCFRTVLTTHNAEKKKKRSRKESEITEGNEILRILEIIVTVKSDFLFFFFFCMETERRTNKEVFIS